MSYPKRLRRKRFTVKIARVGDPLKLVILAYGTEDARRHYEQRGYQVLSVVAGDHRHDAVSSASGWSMIPANYKAAIQSLGIEWPVTVKQTGHKGGRYGAHQVRPSGGIFSQPVHHITVKSWLTPEQAGRTLWHELCHAMQSERCAKRAGARGYYNVSLAWRSATERSGDYQRRPVEVEARTFEPRNDDLPLAR